ncbi:hypothetical protein ACLKA7_000120, partial [Drosophila subpalustris]
NGELQEQVYMNISEGYSEFLRKLESGVSVGSKQKPSESKHIAAARRSTKAINEMKNPTCLIKKALYGLRQSGLQWYVKLTESLKDVGLEPTKQDPCFFVKRQEDKILLVTIYVDDLLLASNHPKWLTQTKAHLSKAFEIKDIGPVKSCLGIEFEQDIAKRQVFMSQRKYIDVMLRRFGMIDCKPAMTPIETKCNLKRLEVADQHDMNRDYVQQQLGPSHSFGPF